MSQELVALILKAYQQPESQAAAKQVHSCFLRTTFYLPMEQADAQPEPKPLYLVEHGQSFLPVFSARKYLTQWQGEAELPIQTHTFVGRQLVRGVDQHTFICLDIGQDHYKQFSPDEIAHLRDIVQRLDSMAEANR